MTTWPNNVTVNERTTSSFAAKVYGWMTMGLFTTAMVALFMLRTNAFINVMPYLTLVLLATMGVSLVIPLMVHRLSFAMTSGLFFVYSALQGVTFGTILPVFAASYGGEVIWMAFLTAAMVYGLAMCYGMFTQTDLTRLRPILSMSLWGLIGASTLFLIGSFFFNLTWASLGISYVGLILFIAMTAYHAQNIRRLSLQIDANSTLARKLSVMQALLMYASLIAIFWYLLMIFSGRRR